MHVIALQTGTLGAGGVIASQISLVAVNFIETLEERKPPGKRKKPPNDVVGVST